MEPVDVDEIVSSLFKGHAYKYRNVYKSILSHMCVYVKNNRDDLTRVLTTAGYAMAQVEHALYKVSFDYDNKQKKDKVVRSQNIVLQMLGKKTIFTYILRETANAMLQSWRGRHFGKIIDKNRHLYIEGCETIYEYAVKLLGEAAQGKSFII